VLELVALRLLDRLRAFLPVGAGVGHCRIVEPVAEELARQAVVKARIPLRLLDRPVREATFVPAIADRDQWIRLRETAVVAGPEHGEQVAVDVDLLGEIGLEQADVTEQDGVPFGLAPVEGDHRLGLVVGVRQLRAVAEAEAQAYRRALEERMQPAPQQRNRDQPAAARAAPGCP
jgi:hypothetical protein